MSGRKNSYLVELTETEFRHLQQVVSSRKSPQSEAKRALQGADECALVSVRCQRVE